MLKIEIIDSEKAYPIYEQARTWDKDGFFSKYDDFELDEPFSKFVAAYKDDVLVGYGQIQKFPMREEVYLSYLVNPEYRRQGIASNILRFMINYSEYHVKGSVFKIEVLKENEAGIEFIESKDFEFEKFDDEKVTFQKKLIKAIENDILK